MGIANIYHLATRNYKAFIIPSEVRYKTVERLIKDVLSDMYPLNKRTLPRSQMLTVEYFIDLQRSHTKHLVLYLEVSLS